MITEIVDTSKALAIRSELKMQEEFFEVLEVAIGRHPKHGKVVLIISEEATIVVTAKGLVLEP